MKMRIREKRNSTLLRARLRRVQSGKRKRPERPERKEPGAEPREIESEMASPEGAEDWIGVFMIRKFANLLILEILSP